MSYYCKETAPYAAFSIINRLIVSWILLTMSLRLSAMVAISSDDDAFP